MPMILAAIVAVLLCLGTASADHYDVLKVSRSADEKDIKKAFKRLAKELHPDSASNSDERERRRKRFIEVSEAYEVLSDPKRRSAYDESGGRRSLSQGDDRNFLRYNLFADFNGVAADAQALEDALSKGAPKGGAFIVFFWSSNFPECIDAAPAYKALAIKLAGTSITPMHFKCDDGAHICRQVVHGVPAIVLFQGKNRFKFDGKHEVQALTEFVTQRLKHQIHTSTLSSFDKCPRVPGGPAPEFLRQCLIVTERRELVAFEYSPCFDCDSEMLLAVDTVRRSIPDLQVEKISCPRGRQGLCKRLADRNRAWTLASIEIRTGFSITKQGVVAVEEESLFERKFDGRFFILDFVAFIVRQRPTHSVVLNAQRLRNAKRSNDSFAILMFDEKSSVEGNELIQWQLLASYLNRVKPYRTKRGRLRILSVNCAQSPDVCRDLGNSNRPSIALYPFGLKAKSKPPVNIANQGLGWTLLQQRILEEAEPLHLYVLDAKTYDVKVSKSLSAKDPKFWVVLFNAGQWCPPCNQIRPAWKDVARLIQKSSHSKKINVGLVECDTHKALCNQLQIESYPTVFFMAKGRTRQEFGGNRDAKSIVEWATEMIDSRVVQMHPGALMNTIQNAGTLLVSFTAGSWCPPCTQLGPIFKQASSKIGDVTATVVNCDEQQHLCQSQGIDGFPTIILYHQGQRIVYDHRDRKVDLIADFVSKNVRR